MNVAILSSSRRNPFAAIIIKELHRRGKQPVVISTTRSVFQTIRKRLGKKLSSLLPGKSGNQGTAAQSRKDYYRKYAESHGITNWRRSLAGICRDEGIELCHCSGINSSEAIQFVRNHEIDILINSGSELFRSGIIDAVRGGILNLHMGYLPTYRGMNALEWSVFYGQKPGVTAHFIDKGIDTGDILKFKELTVEPGDTILELRQKSGRLNIELTLNVLDAFAQGILNRVAQRPEDGKQSFVMHSRLKAVAEKRLARKIAIERN